MGSSSPCRFLLFLSLVCLATGGLVPGKWFDHIFIMIFENTAYTEALADPNFSSLASKGVLFTNYAGVAHPSQPNYVAMTSGNNAFVTDDTIINITATNIVDLLEPKGVSWKVYAENYTGSCNLAYTLSSLYYRKHQPFISYVDVQDNSTRCGNIYSALQLDTDLKTPSTMPQYMYFVPNINNDGHNTGVTYAGNWLINFLPSRISLFPPRTLFYITFDEDDNTPANHIATFMFGNPSNVTAKAGSVDGTSYNHYSQLRLVEDNWSLGNLGRNDATATAINPINFNSTYSNPSPTTTASSTSSSSSSLHNWMANLFF